MITPESVGNKGLWRYIALTLIGRLRLACVPNVYPPWILCRCLRILTTVRLHPKADPVAEHLAGDAEWDARSSRAEVSTRGAAPIFSSTSATMSP